MTISAQRRQWIQLRIALILVLLGSLTIASGQTFLGSVVGVVSDPSGSVVPGVEVDLLETRTGIERRTTTTSAGNYTFAELPAGTYTFKVVKTGFREAASSEILLGTQQTARFDVALEVGAVSERVTVEAQAPALNTENATFGAVVTRNEIIDLPINNAGPMALRYLSSSNQDGGYLAGQRSSFGFYSVDGVSAMAPAWGAWSGPTLSMSNDAIQDITQVTATPSAECTISAGAWAGR